ncbi:hypothetical protein [Crocinitomix catalasitica]|uniref:hypothetical protein n=1 Tax=Crocinitomix catalasitica TaxID=184607 RepID=UPI00055C72F1|nr:hypothetical protein [Crocinitomix catalasitica]
MKKKLTLVMLVTAGALMTGMTSCKKEGCTDAAATNYDEDAKKDDGSCITEVEGNEVKVTGNITSNTTWTKDKVYILTTRVAVTSGATLTIEAGTVIKGDAGTGANATALVIAKDAKLMAKGTAAEPIIFTSVADKIVSGQIASPNLSPDLDGLWGGLLILGNAEISADAASVQIEGIPVSDPNGLYGGTNNADNSGVIEYISIRHGGANIGEGNEINGLTLGGVGSGTTINHVEIIANQDDGIEWFGGSVSVNNAVVWNAGDDAIDTDQSWSGTLDNFIVINAGDECFELDGPEGAMEAKHTIKNGSVYADGADGLVDLDDNSWVDMSNIYFFGVSAGQDFDQIPTVYACAFAAFQATLPDADVTAFFKDGADAFVTTVAEGANTVGADKSVFNTWSWAAVNGSLADF